MPSIIDVARFDERTKAELRELIARIHAGDRVVLVDPETGHAAVLRPAIHSRTALERLRSRAATPVIRRR